MVETTLLVVSGRKLTVPRILKRSLQIAIAVALTAAVFLVVIVGNGLLVGRQVSLLPVRSTTNSSVTWNTLFDR